MGEKRRFEGSDQDGHGHKRSKDGNSHFHTLTRDMKHYKSSGNNKGNSHAYDMPKVPPYTPQKSPHTSSSSPYSGHQVKRPALPPITDEKLSKAVFTHPNTRNSKDAGLKDDSMTYEPLEFLGDAYIEVIATRLIHCRFPHFNTGERAQTRENLVRNLTLAEFSVLYGWDRPGVIATTGQERQEGGKIWTKILGDVFEAYVGAIMEDDKANGFAMAEAWLQELWEPYLQTIKEKSDANPRINVGELKERLQTLLMNPRAGVKIEFVNGATPRMVKNQGATVFTRDVLLTGWGHVQRRLGRGESTNRTTAEGLAIQEAFAREMDLIMRANRLKKCWEAKVKAAKEADGPLPEFVLEDLQREVDNTKEEKTTASAEKLKKASEKGNELSPMIKEEGQRQTKSAAVVDEIIQFAAKHG